jgi:uncharacterized protein with FMN-binding domain
MAPAAAAPASVPEAAGAAGLPSSASLASAGPTDAPVPAGSPAAATPAAPQYKDGTYTGWGSCRHGDIQASVLILGGRIASASISQCWTQYPCSWIAPLPPQVVQRQSPEVDFVSGATQSTNAFYYALLDALKKAK